MFSQQRFATVWWRTKEQQAPKVFTEQTMRKMWWKIQSSQTHWNCDFRRIPQNERISRTHRNNTNIDSHFWAFTNTPLTTIARKLSLCRYRVALPVLHCSVAKEYICLCRSTLQWMHFYFAIDFFLGISSRETTKCLFEFLWTRKIFQ